MKTRLHIAGSAALWVLTAGPALSGPATALPGQKLDSGLGELARCSKWVDESGRDPLGRKGARLAQARH